MNTPNSDPSSQSTARRAARRQAFDEFFVELGIFFRSFGRFLDRIASVLARWSWWRIVGLSILMMISGGILDEALITNDRNTTVSQTIRIEPANKEQVGTLPSKSGSSKSKGQDEVKLKVGGAEIIIKNPPNLQSSVDELKKKVEDLMAKREEAAKKVKETGRLLERREQELAKGKTESLIKELDQVRDDHERALQEVQAAEQALEIERLRQQESIEQKKERAEEVAREVARTVGESARRSESETRELERSLRKLFESQFGDLKSDETPIIQVETDRKDAPDRSPFGKLSVLLVIAMIALKVVGNSRLRERAASARADSATATAEEQNLQRQVAEAKLLRMQAQVEPHFLFNTLASLERLIEVNPTRALAMSQALSQWLRALLPQMKEGQSTLGHEVNLVQSYLQLMQMRMGERLAFFVDVPENLRQSQIPSMLLQPLVENSIKHGLEPKKQGGEIRIKAREQGEYLTLFVEDTGVGFSQNPGSGNGLTNLRERLDLLFGGDAVLSITPRQQNFSDSVQSDTLAGTLITIRLPIKGLHTSSPTKGT